MIPSLRNKSYKERLALLSVSFSVEKRHVRGKVMEHFKILKGFTNVDANKLFLVHGCITNEE